MIICLDYGHGGIDNTGIHDPGAVGPAGTQEADVVTVIGEMLSNKLEEAGHQVVKTRTYHSKDAESLSWRAWYANQNDADIFISIHCNAAESEDAHGTETYSCAEGASGTALAQCVQIGLVNALDRADRGVKYAKFTVLTKTAMPACLAELAFISNTEEEQILNSPEGQEAAAQGLFDGITGYLAGGTKGQNRQR